MQLLVTIDPTDDGHIATVQSVEMDGRGERIVSRGRLALGAGAANPTAAAVSAFASFRLPTYRVQPGPDPSLPFHDRVEGVVRSDAR